MSAVADYLRVRAALALLAIADPLTRLARKLATRVADKR